MASKFCPLSANQIETLTAQGCTCEDWSKVCVAEKFNPATVNSTHFSGKVQLGVFNKKITFPGGLTEQAGINDATIHNCTIGDNTYINHIRGYIANYVIENDVIIENVDLLAVEGQSSFGNGTEITVLNEAGGREIPIYDNLCAHTAYIIAVYRHRQKVVKKLKAMIADYSSSVSSSMGLVARGARIINCRAIKNVKIGPASQLEEVDRLENGSLNSCQKDPLYIGAGVIAKDFIVCSGTKITERVIISKCFVGQGCILAKQYLAENSAFFANCEGFNGEACSIFAGPYTVTHHKSTLLIAGLFSFFNAGSGSNQSNHMYKLGPVHQGVLERGSKTGSNSYILWPAKVGPFTIVTGKHYNNPDTSDMPFSYLKESKGQSILIPGVNLKSVGTIRDARKWPKRDRRKSSKNLDYINFKLLNPCTVQKMIKACELLKNLKTAAKHSEDFFLYNNVKIKKSPSEKATTLYQAGIDKFLGNCLIHHLGKTEFKNDKEIQKILKPETEYGKGNWVDLAGLLTPKELTEELLDNIENDTVDTLDQIDKTFRSMYENYPKYEWSWAVELLQRRLAKNIDQITAQDIIKFIKQWKQAVTKLDRMVLANAAKEFADTVKIGYGPDGDEKTKQADFNAVRGEFEQNSFVADVEKHTAEKTSLADEVITRIKKVASNRPDSK